MKTKLYKGSLQTIILKLLEQNGRMYGYQICKSVKTLSNNDINITEGALYPTLHKLESTGVIEAEFEKVSGRNRKYYKLTEKGKTETVNKTDELISFIENMQIFLKPNAI
ncbi:MAG: PadR family transcriptional regulator [Flavobacteriales bacterium]